MLSNVTIDVVGNPRYLTISVRILGIELTPIAKCISNIGMQNVFDLNVDYVVDVIDGQPENVKADDLISVYDKFGQKQSCLAERFVLSNQVDPVEASFDIPARVLRSFPKEVLDNLEYHFRALIMVKIDEGKSLQEIKEVLMGHLLKGEMIDFIEDQEERREEEMKREYDRKWNDDHYQEIPF